MAHYVLFLLICIHTMASTFASSVVVQGAGSTLPMTLYLDALFAYRFVEPNVQITFDSSTSDQAFCRLMNYTKECSATDTASPQYLDWGSVVALPKADAYTRYPDLQLYPTVASAVGVIYNLNGITGLVLTLGTIAKIWSGRITTWDHPDIQTTNPNFSSWNVPANQSITLVARADSVGTTQVFKKTLAGVDSVFRTQVGTASAATWSGTQPVLKLGLQLLVSYVLCTPYSMGYSVLGDALLNQVPVAKLNRSGIIVEASAASVQYAMLELGLAFGNNGDDKAHLTADLYGAVNPLAWPITSYAYVAVRKSTLRAGATCATVAAMVDFWLWFWSSTEAATIAASYGFSILPQVVRNFIVSRFTADLRCNGVPVWKATQLTPLAGYGPESAIGVFSQLQQVYGLVNDSVALNFSSAAGADPVALLQAPAFVVTTSPLSTSSNVVSLVLAGQALVAASQFTLTLDGLTLAKILNGDIQIWLHPDIVALNPAGLVDLGGARLNDTAQRIVLLQGPTARSAALTALLRSYFPAYTGAAILAAKSFPDEVTLRSAVLGTAFALSVTALVGQLPAELRLASVVAAGGAGAVAPTLAAIKACASADVYNAGSNTLNLGAVNNSSCYPLSLTLYLSAPRLCQATPQAPADLTAPVVDFVRWLYSGDEVDAALLQLNMVPFQRAFDTVQAANDEALFQLSCRVRPVPTPPTNLLPLLLGIIIPIVAVVLLGVGGCGWWLWRVTENNRLLRQKFSNDNVAESCAEAIARFDLASVVWLQDVPEPNKIQRAFLAIIGLLTEVKPYIPDHLLSRLMHEESAKREEAEVLPTGRGSVLSKHSATTSRCTEAPPQRDRLQSVFSARSAVSPRGRGAGALTSPRGARPRKGTTINVRGSIMAHEGTKSLLAMKDWTHKRCTYMCVRFGSTHGNADKCLPELVRVAGRIVDIAKAHGATIDAVGVDFINVHWGVTLASNVSSTRSVSAGLEIAKLRATLPDDQQKSFWLQMGIGKGSCDCGTISTESGHRFFVVWGPEPRLAAEIAGKELPQRVLGSILLSPSVHQEVQFTVHCAPRLWHGDALLWEPVKVLKAEENDEWMYELRRIDSSKKKGDELQDTFLLARTPGTTKAVLQLYIAKLKAALGDALSPADVASLDLLLSSAPGVAGGLAGAGGDGASAINSAPTVAGAVAVAGDGDSDGDSDVLFIAEV